MMPTLFVQSKHRLLKQFNYATFLTICLHTHTHQLPATLWQMGLVLLKKLLAALRVLRGDYSVP